MTAHPLSVLIATHNRRELLARCLEALAQQTEDPASFEVIVADDGSADGSAAMAEALATPYRLQVLKLAKGGKPAALNAALQVAQGEIGLFLDDDIIAAPELVAAHLEAHRREPRALALGRLTQRPPRAHDWFAQAYARDWNQRYDQLTEREVGWADCYGANFSVSLATLREVGGFAADLAAVEDIELAFRLAEAGCRPVYLPAAAAVHDDEKLRGPLLRDTERFGAFCAGFGDRHPQTRAQLLGWFLDTTNREVFLRRALLIARLPTRALAAPGRLLPDEGRRQTWFGFVSRYAFWRGVRGAMKRRRWLETTRGVPVLMYHAFSEGDSEDRYVLGARSLRRQLRLLKALRYRVITYGELVAAQREGRMPAHRTAVLTIDDGYRDNLSVAEPILRRHGYPATVFLVSGHLGGSNDWTADGELAGRPLLTTAEAERLRAAGIELGGHTRSHPSLLDEGIDDLSGELEGCRLDLERALGRPVTCLAYPYGDFDAAVAAATGAAGFASACTVAGRRARLGDDPLLIPRIEVRGTESAFSFLRKLVLGGN